jgi:hypothetical protein
MAAAEKERGQHGEVPFECVNLDIGRFGKWKVTSEAELKDATLQAIAEAAKYMDLKKMMDQIVREAAALSVKSRREVKALIAKLKVPTP